MKKNSILLKKAELAKFQKQIPTWILSPKATSFSRLFNFKNHLDALVFIARVTVHAQVLDHHPDILFSYKKVKVTLTTNDVKGLTRNDIELAKKIDVLKISG